MSLLHIILRSFIWYIKNHPAFLKFSKNQYNFKGFLIAILFVVSFCTVGNLITFHLDQEVHCIVSVSLEIIITLTCPGLESALGSQAF